jgi:hypothetical protein
VRARLIVIGRVSAKDMTQMPFTEDDRVVSSPLTTELARLAALNETLWDERTSARVRPIFSTSVSREGESS